MKKLSYLFLFFFLGLMVLITGCGGSVGQAAAQAAATPTPAQPTIPVEVATVQTGNIDLIFDYSGALQSKQIVSVVPEANGRIVSLPVEVGDQVKAGDPLAVIEQDTYEAQLEQAQAGLAKVRLNLAKMKSGSRPEEITAAQAAVGLAKANVNDVANVNDNERTVAATNLANAEAALKKAQAEYDKIAWASDVGETPQATTLEQATIAYQSALANYNLATHPSDSTLAPLMAQLSQAELKLALTLTPYRDIDLQMAQADVQQAEAAVKLSQLQLDKTTIVAPFDGVVAELYVTEGSTVGPQAPIAMFVSNTLEVLINVEEERISKISKNQSAGLTTAAYPDQDFSAVVTSIAPVADQDTHTFAVKVTPLDEAGLLRSGMSANVSILAKGDENSLLVPRSAVTQMNNQDTVFVVKDNHIVEQRVVTTGLTNTDQVEILKGLKAGEQVVVAGQSNLVDGATVKIVKGT